jgi:hypothetical protein
LLQLRTAAIPVLAQGRILPLAGPAVIAYSLIAVISQRTILPAMLPIPGFIADFVFVHQYHLLD